MKPQAENELLDLVMVEDFVDRRKALDTWTKRWVATAVVEGRWEAGLPPKEQTIVRKLVVNDMRGEIFDALVDDQAKVMGWEFDGNTARVTLCCLKAVPAEIE